MRYQTHMGIVPKEILFLKIPNFQIQKGVCKTNFQASIFEVDINIFLGLRNKSTHFRVPGKGLEHTILGFYHVDRCFPHCQNLGASNRTPVQTRQGTINTVDRC